MATVTGDKRQPIVPQGVEKRLDLETTWPVGPDMSDVRPLCLHASSNVRGFVSICCRIKPHSLDNEPVIHVSRVLFPQQAVQSTLLAHSCRTLFYFVRACVTSPQFVSAVSEASVRRVAIQQTYFKQTKAGVATIAEQLRTRIDQLISCRKGVESDASHQIRTLPWSVSRNALRFSRVLSKPKMAPPTLPSY